MKKMMAASLLLAAGWCSGAVSAADKNAQPWAEIAVGAAGAANPDVYNVIVVAIDGSMEFDHKRAYRLSPDVHFVELATTKVGRRGELTRQPFVIETKPCVRYELVATHTQTLSNTRWIPTVKAEKLIVACAEKFKITPTISPTQQEPAEEAPAPIPEPASSP